jgi:oligosaccharide repeat unit polymerase
MITALVILLIFISFLIERRSFISSPILYFLLIWVIVFALYESEGWVLNDKTILVTILFIFVYFIVFHLIILSVNRRHLIFNYTSFVLNPLSKFEKNSYIVICIIAVSGAMLYLFAASGLGVLQILASDSNDDVRKILATSNTNVPLYAKIINQAFYCICPILFFSSINFMKSKSINNLAFLILIFTLSVLYSSLLMQRSLILMFGVFAFFPLIIFQKNILKVIVLSFTIITLFFLLFHFVEVFRNSPISEQSLFDKVYYYFVGGMFGLDAFISGSDTRVELLEVQKNYITVSGFSFDDITVGMSTFTVLYKTIAMLFSIEYVIPNHGEYIITPFKTNIYTGIRAFYQDFYYLGILIGATILATMSAFVHVLKGCVKYQYVNVFMLLYINYVLIRFFGGYVFDLRFVVMSFIVLILLFKINTSKWRLL